MKKLKCEKGAIMLMALLAFVITGIGISVYNSANTIIPPSNYTYSNSYYDDDDYYNSYYTNSSYSNSYYDDDYYNSYYTNSNYSNSLWNY